MCISGSGCSINLRKAGLHNGQTARRLGRKDDDGGSSRSMRKGKMQE
jgi:hypothetical protein